MLENIIFAKVLQSEVQISFFFVWPAIFDANANYNAVHLLQLRVLAIQ